MDPNSRNGITVKRVDAAGGRPLAQLIVGAGAIPGVMVDRGTETTRRQPNRADRRSVIACS
jgi:hypothetical protein